MLDVKELNVSVIPQPMCPYNGRKGNYKKIICFNFFQAGFVKLLVAYNFV